MIANSVPVYFSRQLAKAIKKYHAVDPITSFAQEMAERGGFMQILIEHYDAEWDETAPEVIKELTREYVEDNNDVGRFFESVMEKSEDKGDFILMTDLFNLYETHCSRKHKPRPQRGNFKNQLIAYIDTQRHGVFKAQHTIRTDGKFKTVKNVAKEWRLKPESW